MAQFKFRKKRRLHESSLELEEAVVARSFSNSKYEEDAIPHIALAPSLTRAVAMVCLFMLGIVILFTGKISMQADAYRARANNNISREVRIPAIRGGISDRFGKPLLSNIPGFQISVRPSELPKDIEARSHVITQLAGLIGMDGATIETTLSENLENSDSIFLTRDISTEDLIRLKSYELPGVQIIEEVHRKYEGGEAFSHIVGYVGQARTEDKKRNPNLENGDIVGRSGLEAFYDGELRGKNGVRIFKKDIEAKTFSEGGTEVPEAGYSLETTIDADFQRYVFSRFQEGLAALGRERGFAVVLDPNTGEVLSLVSIPSFDSNWFSHPSQYRETIQSLLVDPNKPLFNRAVSGVYNPGSTIKPLVALAALEEGIIDPRKTFDDPGYLLVPNQYNPESPSVFVDWKAHGIVDMRKALAVSANVYFYIVGGGTDYQKGLGVERLTNYYREFNLGDLTGIDIAGEVAGRIPAWNDPARKSPWRLGDTYNISIGQGDFLVTPVALANYIASIANGGTLYQPHIVKQIKTDDNNIVREIVPQVLARDLADENNIRIVTEGMRDVVRQPYGTGYRLADLPFSVAGKSGTAQFGDKKTINALFAAFAPAKDPKIALVMLVENAKEGALNVIPIVEDVLMWYYLNRGL